MKIINMTPHELNIFASDRTPVATVPPSGEIARLDVRREMVASHDGVEIFRSVYGSPSPLPPAEPDTAIVVSALYLSGFRAQGMSRPDLFVPGEAVRDEQGRQIGCIGLSQ